MGKIPQKSRKNLLNACLTVRKGVFFNWDLDTPKSHKCGENLKYLNWDVKNIKKTKVIFFSFKKVCLSTQTFIYVLKKIPQFNISALEILISD